MRAYRLVGQASIILSILILAVLNLSFHSVSSVYAAPDTPERNTTFVSSSPAAFQQSGPDLQAAMTASFSVVNAGEPVSFTLFVTNIGSATAQSVTLTNPLPTVSGLDWTIESSSTADACTVDSKTNTLVCTIGSMPPAGWFLVKVVSPTTYQSCGTLTNTYTVSAVNEPLENTSNNSASASTMVQCPSLEVTKTAVAAQVAAGTPVSFSMSVVNRGPGKAYGVQLRDQLPGTAAQPGPGLLNWQIATPTSPCVITDGMLTCPKVDLQPNEGFEVLVSAPTGTDGCGSYSNTVSVLSANHPIVEKSARVDLLCATLLLSKTSDTPQISAGETASFSLLVKNAGTTDAQNVTLTDTLPVKPGVDWQAPQGCAIANGVMTCSFGTLAPGDSRSVKVVSPTTFDSCGELTNQAVVQDAAGRSMSASATVTILCPQLTFSKTAKEMEVQPGSSLAFALLVRNSGPGTAFNIHVSDSLTAGFTWTVDNAACKIENNLLTCDWANLPALAEETVNVTSETSPKTCGPVTNTAALTAANFAPLEASASINITCPDVTVTKTAKTSPLRPGDTAEFSIVVTNSGSGTAVEVSLTDTLPSGVTWSVDTASACKIDNNALTCTLGDLLAAQSVTINVTGVVGDFCGKLTNQVSVSASNEPGSATSNNSAEASIDVQCLLKDLVVSKTAMPTFDQVYQWRISKTADPTRVWQMTGSLADIDFSIAVKQTGIHDEDYDLNGLISITNPNATAVSGVNVTDQVSNGGTCSVTGGTDITIPADETVTLNYHCDYPDDLAVLTGTNTATVTWDSAAGTQNHSATATADFTFGSGSKDNPQIKNQTVTIRDTFLGVTIPIGKVSGASNPPYASKTFAHSIPVLVVPGCITYTNTASLKETGQSSSVDVTVCGSLKTGAKPPSFWHDDKGQKIIRTLDEKPVCDLTPWLRQFAPFQDLSSKAPCPAVASYVKTTIDKAGHSHATTGEKLKAQALATALNIFFSDPKLGGNALNAPHPIGGYTIDLTRICSSAPEDGNCSFVNASSAFDHKTSLTILQALTIASSESNAGGSTWYDSSSSKITQAYKTFRAINNEWAFGVPE